MDLRRLTDTIFVAPQIDIADLPRLADAGFTTLIDNRPDGEIEAALQSARMAEAAEAAGLVFHYLPIEPGGLTPALADRLGSLIDEAAQGAEPGDKILAYCRSGTRSASAWALSQSGRRPRAEILETAARAGYDLSGLAGYLS
ncbi:TIGR01244 family sulfur transferase [Paracoccus sanguinis]|uniref:TIGR01244 family sulfur transferase n=1 Tax=Paracoccus sanguinis TaxID=1545044 RepID=UPI00051FCE52|nr:TIGR01244 family sulfur transferase [Paracoccus sanguinis]KGJ17228.1 hypothetical protein IX55_13400 [Paracoccus sanguinis]